MFPRLTRCSAAPFLYADNTETVVCTVRRAYIELYRRDSDILRDLLISPIRKRREQRHSFLANQWVHILKQLGIGEHNVPEADTMFRRAILVCKQR